MLTKQRATIDDLYGVEGKAEIVNGGSVHFMPTGGRLARSAGSIYLSLRGFEREYGVGFAVPDNAGFHVKLPWRDSFSPDAAFFVGEDPGMRFYEGVPRFAVEVRSEFDKGPAAEQEMADKRRDYFEAGTEVVWDVDLHGQNIVRKYTRKSPEKPVIYRRGEIADAEPALPGWQMAVDELFG